MYTNTCVNQDANDFTTANAVRPLQFKYKKNVSY